MKIGDKYRVVSKVRDLDLKTSLWRGGIISSLINFNYC